jgi:hypothetical protein
MRRRLKSAIHSRPSTFQSLRWQRLFWCVPSLAGPIHPIGLSHTVKNNSPSPAPFAPPFRRAHALCPNFPYPHRCPTLHARHSACPFLHAPLALRPPRDLRLPTVGPKLLLHPPHPPPLRLPPRDPYPAQAPPSTPFVPFTAHPLKTQPAGPPPPFAPPAPLPPPPPRRPASPRQT